MSIKTRELLHGAKFLLIGGEVIILQSANLWEFAWLLVLMIWLKLFYILAIIRPHHLHSMPNMFPFLMLLLVPEQTISPLLLLTLLLLFLLLLLLMRPQFFLIEWVRVHAPRRHQWLIFGLLICQLRLQGQDLVPEFPHWVFVVVGALVLGGQYFLYFADPLNLLYRYLF